MAMITRGPLVKKGAEAELRRGEWLGFDVIFKKRVRKEYRNAALDSYIRGARTSLESRLLADARACMVPTPIVYFVDMEAFEIVMSYIPGEPLKKLIDGMDDARMRLAFREIGISVGRLHRGGIVHGDLTTSNIISAGRRLYLIDFGLGEHTTSTEARGVDIHLMRRALESSHHSRSKSAYDSFVEGYRLEMGEAAADVLRRVEEIRRRGRYVEGGR
uniref:non-specific serine/threonine protein kinase n=1 Tax=Candidatus Methanomethylicus mesodigestus TaxID=1867258 RepID=A0A7C3J437_9CREN